MRVRELIRLLKKLNPEAEVLIQAQDHSEDETDGEVTFARASDSEILRGRCGGPVVVIG